MKRSRSIVDSLTLAAVLAAAGLGLSSASVLAAAGDEPSSALFAPKALVPAAEQTQKKVPSTAPPEPRPAPAVKSGSNARPVAQSPHIQVDSQGNKTLVIRGDQASADPPEPRPAPAFKAGSSTRPLAQSPHIQVDSQGNKTLVIRGDQAPQVILDEPGGGQVQVLIGDDTAGLVMDSQGRKTLVVRGGPEPSRGDRSVPPKSGSTRATSPPKPSAAPATQTTPLQRPETVPYFWVEDTQDNSRPYFEMDPVQESRPYWEVERVDDPPPYWAMTEDSDDWPYYWLEKPQAIETPPPEPLTNPVQMAEIQRPLAAPVDDGKQMTIAYYMYRDERGVPQITNIPDDPRYRLFTAVVTVQRGLSAAGPRIRFTHETLRPVIMKAARIYNLDPALIAAVIKSESAFDSRAVSWAGAQGLMQLMPKTARDMGVLDSFNPEENVMGGSRYLRKMLDQFGGDLTLAIAAYNCGPTRVAKVWRVPDIAETQNYVKIVKRNYDRYKLIF